MTLGTRLRPGSRGSAAAGTLVARLQAAELDLLLSAKRRFFQRDLDTVLQIVSGACRAGALAASTLTSAKKHVKEVVKRTLTARTESSKPSAKPAGSAAAHLRSAFTECVVLAAFIGIFQNIVGRVDLFELVLGLLVAPRFVGMVLVGELEVGLADLLIRSRTRIA